MKDKKAIPKLSETDQVTAYMEILEHPLKVEVEALRNIIKNANNKLKERIKWNSPSYYYEKDMAAFNLRDQKRVHIVFVFYNGDMIHESNGLLEGDYKDRRMAYFHSMEDIKAKRAALEKVVNDWVDLIDKH